METSGPPQDDYKQDDRPLSAKSLGMAQGRPQAFLWNTPQIAAYLNVKEGTIRYWGQVKYIAHIKFQNLVRFRKTDIDAWLDQRTAPGRTAPGRMTTAYRDIDMLDPLHDVLARHRLTCPNDAVYVFRNLHGNPLGVDNLRNKVWYPALKKAKLRKRTMYQTRHTFASLMLAHGEDPLWIARMLGHSTLQMVFQHYGKFIRNRMRKDGVRFTPGMTEAGLFKSVPKLPEGPAVVTISSETAKPLPAGVCEPTEKSGNPDFGHTLGTLYNFVAKKGAAETATP